MIRPEITAKDFGSIIATKRRVIGDKPDLWLYGVRGFFSVKSNERGVFDDAIFLMTSFEWDSWNANTDPSTYTPGIASLRPGVWWFKQGIHHGAKTEYPALVQAADFTIVRDAQPGQEPIVQTGQFGIHIHAGGNYETGSLGCQTIVKDQWDNFFDRVKTQMAKYDITSIPYMLVEKENVQS